MGVTNKRSLFRIVQYALVIFAIIAGLRSGLRRDVQDLFEKSAFPERLSIAGMETVRWGRPTSVWGNDIKQEDVENLFRFLRSEDQSFFIFPDFTVLYGLLKKEPPQPFVFFDKGLTYPKVYDPEIDQRIANSLEHNRVRIIVLERISFFGSVSRIRDFPIVFNYIKDNFEMIGNIGMFEIHRRIKRDNKKLK
jgi:hypothetical protein